MARRRQLRPEERELWQAVARTLRPLARNSQVVAQRALVDGGKNGAGHADSQVCKRDGRVDSPTRQRAGCVI